MLTSDSIQKCVKPVCITKDGLNVDWMNQENFHKAALLTDAESQQTPTKSSEWETIDSQTPEGIQQNSKFQRILQIQTTKLSGVVQLTKGTVWKTVKNRKKENNSKRTSLNGPPANCDLIENVFMKLQVLF